MKKDKLKIYALESILLILLLFALFVPNIVNRRVIAVLVLVYSLITSKLIKKRNVESLFSRQVIVLLMAFAVVYLVLFYLMGLYFGYYEAPIKFGLWALDKYIFPFIILVISSEVVRNVFISQKSKISETLVFIAMVLIDLILYIGIYDITTLDGALTIIGYVLFASISCNLLYNYISKRYGIWPIVVYRIITVVYAYIIPFIPDIYTFFKSFLRMIYPYIIYLVLEKLFGKENIQITAQLNKKRQFITGVIIFSFLTLIVMLVSCQFKYGAIVIGSGSMTGTINKGDVIVFEEYKNQKIKNGDIIVFLKDDVKIVHRVIELKNVNGEKRYITKGDKNDNADDDYVTKEEILGIYKSKISYIGYPSLWIRDIFY